MATQWVLPTVFQECQSGNSNNDQYNLRGLIVTDQNGYYGFESIFVQDEITMSDQLTVTLGLRYDDVSGSAPPKNTGFKQTYGFENYGLDKGSSALSWRRQPN